MQEIIRADPEKAEKMYEKFREILIEERRDDLICIHCPLLNHRDDWNEKHMNGSHSYSPGSGSLLSQDVELRHLESPKTW